MLFRVFYLEKDKSFKSYSIFLCERLILALSRRSGANQNAAFCGW
jgi:hypothetical protein